MDVGNDEKGEQEFLDVSNYINKGVYPNNCTANAKRIIRRKANRFRMEGNKLKYLTKKGLWVEIIFSKEQRKQIISSCHSEPISGHLGRTRTFYKVSERFYWPGIFQDIKNFVLFCEKCQHTNTQRFDKTHTELHPIKVQSPWFHIGIDLIGPLPETSAGNNYILTISDYCTKWVAALPLKSKHGSSVATALVKVFMQMGIPRVLTSDQGTEFSNQVNEELMTLLNVKHHFTTAYHPQANGLDERFNQTIQLMLVKFCSDKHTTWDSNLDACTFAYNTSRQESTKYTPFELMFGRKPILPIELEVANESPQSLLSDFSSRPECNQTFMNKIIESRSSILEKAKQNIEKAQEKQKKDYDKRHANPSVFAIDAEVLVKDFTRKKRKEGKLDFRWLGPFRILKNLGKGSYLLQELATMKEKRVNGSHIKPYNRSFIKEVVSDQSSLLNSTMSLYTSNYKNDFSDITSSPVIKHVSVIMSSKAFEQSNKRVLWIKNNLYQLTSGERDILISKTEWLTDTIIFASQKILHKQSLISGFQDPILGINMKFFAMGKNFIQVLHDGYGHWFTVSNIGAQKSNEVFIYNSMLHSLSNHSKKQVAAILATREKNITIKIMSVQQQKGGNDCGLFAVAFATALTYQIQPDHCVFQQNEMRVHLFKSLEEQDLPMFPTESICIENGGVSRIEVTEIFCTCRMPAEGKMVQCLKCGERYHSICLIDITESIFDDSNYFCASCNLLLDDNKMNKK